MIELPIRVTAPEVSHVDALANGTRLGEFEVLGLIGVGGFGMVYRAYDHSLQRDVAIKEYLPTALARRADHGLHITIRASSDHESFHAGLRSFVGEARMLAKFEHPSLVRVFRFWEANDTAYMVMPLYRGMTLKQARQCMRSPPTEAWLRKVLWSILGALKMLHRGKALHRDVSPDNIFLQDIGPPVLLDLGAARLAINDSSKQHTAILKIHYAPIEQYADAHGLPQGPWTDLYALAAVVHGMLCNDAPLPAMIRVVNDTMPAIGNVAKTVASEFGQNYSEVFTQGIAWALQIQPQDRPQSVREFARALEIATPNGMSTFDWRAELGPGSLPTGDVLELSQATASDDKTRPSDTDPDYAPTQFIDAEDDSEPAQTPHTLAGNPAERRNRSRQPVNGPAAAESDSTARRRKASTAATSKHTAATRQRPITVWVIAGLVVLSTLAAVTWGWQSWSGKGRVNTTGNLNTSAQTESTAQIGTPPPVARGAIAIEEPGAIITEREPIETIIETSSPTRATTPSTTGEDKALRANERARKVPPKPIKVEPPRAPTPTEAETTPTAVAVAVSAPEPKPAAPVVTAESLCASANFLTRPMCLYRACQRPDLSATATCVAMQKNVQPGDDTNRF